VGKEKYIWTFNIRMEQAKITKLGKEKRMEKHMAIGKIDRLLDRRTICRSLSIILSFVERLGLGAAERGSGYLEVVAGMA
jgi:hypothetical protein